MRYSGFRKLLKSRTQLLGIKRNQCQLLADDRNGVSGQVALNCALTALLKVGGRAFT
jgi:hypothetical protein